MQVRGKSGPVFFWQFKLQYYLQIFLTLF